MTIDDIKSVCFVGAGTMGCYNSIVAAISGYKVTLYDIDTDTLAQAHTRHAQFAAFLVDNGYCGQEDIPAAVGRITVQPELELAVANADLVSESIIERLDIKREVHHQLDRLCPAKTILSTNSSALLVSDIEDAVERGERFAALHSHLGAPLVDIVGGPRTSAATIDVLRRYVLSLGGVPLLLKKEHPGYVLNAMLGALLSTSMLLVEQGDATVEQVDVAWMRHRNAPMGPFGMIDLFGINLVCDSWQYRPDDPTTAHVRASVLSLLQPLVERGELGMKSGSGFYHYPAPGYQSVNFCQAAANGEDAVIADVYAVLETAWIGNAAMLAALDIAEPEEIDRAWMVGTYLDTGPMALLASIGKAQFLQRLERQISTGRFDNKKANIVRPYLQGET